MKRYAWITDLNGEPMPTITPHYGTELARMLESKRTQALFEEQELSDSQTVAKIWATVKSGL